MERIGSFGIIAFLLSFGLGIICIYYLVKILISKRVIIKVMEESLGDAASSPSVIAMVCLALGLFAVSFFAVCLALYFFTYAV